MSTSSLRQQAYETIHQWIITGKLPKGQATSEVELSSLMDMSRTPVRAALQQLEQEGFVRIVPKHGVIVLDSSAQRVSDLLEIMISFILFSVNAVWDLKQQEIAEYSTNKLQFLNALLEADTLDPDALVPFEFEFLHGLIQICHNEEMSKMFVHTTTRLFWSNNNKRWKAPNYLETSHTVIQLIALIPSGLEPFRDALFQYLQILKRTWV
ncbi:GntR family transcriptional regulator [Paenibacillus sp. LjRoot153]|uniref:GntR family transcriptional regulator n=1 Tax=Paenibacillus sp. LjRoot153 TaxID=3342270 RepID=UPI003ED02DAF